MSRLTDLLRFYEALQRLGQGLGGYRHLAHCQGRMGWPSRGVYFFFESEELRHESGEGSRVTRVGTHALKEGSRSTLWERLSQHRGQAASRAGNHRGSIFRLLVGEALLLGDGAETLSSWGRGGDPGEAAKRLGRTREWVKTEELPLERRVSERIGAMPFLWLDIDDSPGPGSLRGYIERNAIGLLSNHNKPALDAPSPGWLGFCCSRERVRLSGLWNNNHVEDDYDPEFLNVLDRLVSKTIDLTDRD